MSRFVPILCAACAVGIGLTAWSQLCAGDTSIAIPTGGSTAGDLPNDPTADDHPAGNDPRASLREARRQCSLQALDAVVQQLQAAAVDTTDSMAWHVLAEAHLERALQRTHLRGMVVGEPVFAELPDDFAEDLAAGLAAALKAREHGDDSGALFRIEAGLMGQHITGLGTALQWNSKIAQALKSAGERIADDPQLHVALGLRKLFAPRWLGHDPDKALEHFEFAANTDDERAAVFAAMASYLQQKRQQAIGWLEHAVEKNPDNKFAGVVLRRLRRGEDNPFGRNVSEAEVAAIK